MKMSQLLQEKQCWSIHNTRSENLSKDQTVELKKTLNNMVLFLSRTKSWSRVLSKFCQEYCQPVVYPRLKGLDEKFPFINVIERKPSDKNLSFGSSWLHQDTSYLSDDRPRYTMLMGIEVPMGQGNTIFSSGFNAYKKLPEEIKNKIQKATGVFSSAGPIAVTRLEREKEMGIKTWKHGSRAILVKTVNSKKHYMFLLGIWSK